MTLDSPADFPVPADLAGFWLRDRVRAPRPLTPLSQQLVLGAMSDGLSAGLREMGYPRGLQHRSFNAYAYVALVPHASPPATSAADAARAIDTLLAGLAERWDREWLPAIRVGLDRLHYVDYARLSDEALVAEFDALRRDLVARWRIHGFLLFSYQAASTFDDFYRAVFAPADPTEAYQVLGGQRTRASDANWQLWHISRRVRRTPELLHACSATPPHRLAAVLEDITAGRALLVDVRQYLDEYGWRSDAVLELAEPMWREDLTIPLNALRELVRLDDSFDPELRLQQLAARREHLLDQARVRLAGHPEQRARFERLYMQAAHHVRLDEDHNFYIDQMGTAGLRRPILELGRRLVARHAAIQRLDDVFFLELPEIVSGLRGRDQSARVAARRAELAHWATVTPPATLGAPPAAGAIDPLGAAILKFAAPLVPHAHTASLIRGTPASPGVARGRAKVARSLAEASTVEPGQILVCERTLPPWSVLFSTVAAVVADTGGVLSHCATVARECGIPCVVGTRVGTTAIPNGALLDVDGTRGEVHILA